MAAARSAPAEPVAQVESGCGARCARQRASARSSYGTGWRKARGRRQRAPVGRAPSSTRCLPDARRTELPAQPEPVSRRASDRVTKPLRLPARPDDTSDRTDPVGCGRVAAGELTRAGDRPGRGAQEDAVLASARGGRAPGRRGSAAPQAARSDRHDLRAAAGEPGRVESVGEVGACDLLVDADGRAPRDVRARARRPRRPPPGDAAPQPVDQLGLRRVSRSARRQALRAWPARAARGRRAYGRRSGPSGPRSASRRAVGSRARCARERRIVLIPASRAASTFSFRPPIGSTSPRR